MTSGVGTGITFADETLSPAVAFVAAWLAKLAARGDCGWSRSSGVTSLTPGLSEI
jgi:hypothetical protein